jgi:signal transduction histidine kinase
MWLQSRLPMSTLTFAVGVLALVATAAYMGLQSQRALDKEAVQRQLLDEAVAAAEELDIILLRLEDGRATADTVNGAMRARLARAKDNPYLTQSPAARRIAEDLAKSTLNVSDMLQSIAQLQSDLHRQSAELMRRTARIGAVAARDLWVVAGILIIISLIYVITAWGHSRQLSNLAATARDIRGGDLTARASTQSGGEVAELANDFNEMVEILVASLAQEEQHVRELRQRAAELEAANRHKSRFLANVSHEFKTPLSAVLGFTQVLESDLHGPLTDKQRDYVSRIGAAGDHLKSMIGDLIDAARIDLATLQLTPVDLAADLVVREAVDMLEANARSRGITLQAAADNTTTTIHHDPARLRQVLINLTGNAIKFTPKNGRVTVTVREEAGSMIFTVDDDGPGIAETDRERVFEDFVQLDDTLDRRHEGTGMGLAISQRLARLMGGLLFCDASPDHKGARFTLSLPTRYQPPEPSANGS